MSTSSKSSDPPSGDILRRIDVSSPAATSSRYHQAALVPDPGSSIVSSPFTTCRLIASLGWGGPCVPKSSSVLVSLSQISAEAVPSEASRIDPVSHVATSSAPSTSMAPRSVRRPQLHVFRNHRWGNTWRVRASSETFRTETSTQMSSAAAFAYVTPMSQ